MSTLNRKTDQFLLIPLLQLEQPISNLKYLSKIELLRLQGTHNHSDPLWRAIRAELNRRDRRTYLALGTLIGSMLILISTYIFLDLS